ncbi:MAG TPA: ABC transporter permease subunit [Gammaproteobacteria bacterium]|nr:ABC transporter permease subunit [Gammaproteobacteria bacterium]
MSAGRGSLKHCWIVFRKELRDGLRDRAAITGLALQAIVSPIIWAAITLVAAQRLTQTELVLPVAGADNAPAFVDWLEAQNDVKIVPAPADPAAAVRDGAHRVVLVIPADFGARMANGLAARVELVTDGAAGASTRAADRVAALVKGYGAELGFLRLMARGVAPEIVTPVRIEATDVSPPGRNGGGLSIFVTMLLLWTALFGGVGVATDSILGERERGSLEPLLLNPVSRTALLAGKWLAAATLACVAVLAAGVATLLVLRSIPWQQYGLQLSSSDGDLLAVTFTMMPLAFFWCALVIWVSTVSRSQQQAQTRYGLLFMTVVLSTIATLMFPLGHVPVGAVPLVGQLTLGADVLGGAQPPVYRYVITAAGSLGLALAVIAATARLLRRETIVFKS